MPTFDEQFQAGQITDPWGYPPERAAFKHVSEQATFLGKAAIGREATIHLASIIGEDCAIGPRAEIGHAVRLGNSVDIGDSVRLAQAVVVYNGAQIGRAAVLHHEVIIGPGVQVPPEAQVAAGAVIPVTHAIATLARVGDSNRVATVYGSPDGPLYSAGCQYGDGWDEFWNRIINVADTTQSSARHYEALEDSWINIGKIVQRAYDAAEKSGQVARLIASKAPDGPLPFIEGPHPSRYFTTPANRY